MKRNNGSCTVFYSTPDTIKYRCNEGYIGCNDLPEKQVLYLGFKYYSPSYTSLGWIRLMVDTYQLTLLDYAVQK
jgi:hypothetical protein